jgi:hypothetical protein
VRVDLVAAEVLAERRAQAKRKRRRQRALDRSRRAMNPDR